MNFMSLITYKKFNYISIKKIVDSPYFFAEFAERRCSGEGQWEGKPGTLSTVNGWTNYTPCYSPEVLKLFSKLYAGGDELQAKYKLDVAERTRVLEIVGFSVSLIALIISLVIFCRFRLVFFFYFFFMHRYICYYIVIDFRSLRNNRTRIHKNLFVAMVIQVLIRLTLYIDQAIIRSGGKKYGNDTRHGIDNTVR